MQWPMTTQKQAQLHYGDTTQNIQNHALCKILFIKSADLVVAQVVAGSQPGSHHNLPLAPLFNFLACLRI